MTTTKYLDMTKAALGITSDYELAKKLEVPKQSISQWRKGIGSPGAYACAKMAITLGLDPALVIAEIEAEHEKNPKRAEFWRGFLGRAAMLLVVVSTLAWSSFDTAGSALAAPGGLLAGVAASAAYATAKGRFLLASMVRIIYIMSNSEKHHQGNNWPCA